MATEPDLLGDAVGDSWQTWKATILVALVGHCPEDARQVARSPGKGRMRPQGSWERGERGLGAPLLSRVEVVEGARDAPLVAQLPVQGQALFVEGYGAFLLA